MDSREQFTIEQAIAATVCVAMEDNSMKPVDTVLTNKMFLASMMGGLAATGIIDSERFNASMQWIEEASRVDIERVWSDAVPGFELKED